MTQASGRPRGRRPGRDDTRGTIRDVAAQLFGIQGYDAVSMRAVARAAGVDKALVHHYFVSKADLFCQACLGGPWAVATAAGRAISGQLEQVGRSLADDIWQQWDADPQPLLDALSGPPGGHAAVAGMLAREMFAPVAAACGHGDGLLRGQIAASTTLGVLLGRHRLALPALAAASGAEIADALGATLQRQLVGPASG